MKYFSLIFFLYSYLPIYATEPLYILITTLYNETNQARIDEFKTCIQKNLAHSRIKTIHVLYDTAKDGNNSALKKHLESLPIEIQYIEGRPSYHLCFEIANRLYSGERIIIANGDIYFNETLTLLDHVDLSDKFLALTRWNVKNNSLIPYTYRGYPITDSQDAWIFESPIPLIGPIDIFMGTWRCDVRMAYYALKTGLHVYNPCKSIQCCHVHESEIRNYHNLEKTKDPYWVRLPWVDILQMR